jgi:hypothetical protein
MATVRVYGPYTWVRPFGQNALLPGEAYVWSLAVDGVVFAVTAHPTRDAPVQALAVESLSTAYAQTGPAAVNFIVRNVSTTGVFSYRWFVSATDI